MAAPGARRSAGGTSFGGGGGGTSYGGGAGGRGVAGGSGGVQISPTNAFAAYYANPMYTGRPGSSSTSLGQASNVLKGAGFGQPSFGSVTTAGGTTTGIAGRTGTAGIANRGLTGGVGGGGYGGLGGGYGGMNSTPQVSYTATVAYSGPAAITPVGPGRPARAPEPVVGPEPAGDHPGGGGRERDCPARQGGQ